MRKDSGLLGRAWFLLFVGILTLSVTNHSLAQDNIDNYTYSLGSGDLVINDTDDDNSLTFSNDISPESLQLSADFQNLYITLPDNAVITVTNWLVLQRQGNPFRLNSFIFSDGSEAWNYLNIANKTIIHGSAGDDIIEMAMTNINWHIKPGRGNDEITLWKKYGKHKYYYDLGDGNDVIHNKSSDASTLKLGPGITPDNLSLHATMDAMHIVFSDNARITIDGWATGYTYGPFAISNIEFADGTVWNYRKIGSVLELRGSNTADIIDLSHLDIPIGIRGGEGNDQIVMGKGKHTYYYNLGDGTDTISDIDIYGTVVWGEGISPDNLNITATDNQLTYSLEDVSAIYINNWFKGNTYYPFSINNMIFADGTVWDYRAVGRNTILTGTEQNDVINYGEYTLTIGVRAGKGDDTLVFASGERDYYYDPGDGNDTIDSSSLYDRLHLGQGILPDQIRFRATGLDMQILLPDNAVITVLNWETGYPSWDFRINKIYFSNGVVWDLKEIARQIERSNDNPDPVPGTLNVNDQSYQVSTYDPAHDLAGTAEITSDGNSLNLTGNLWKKIDVNYPITPNTILEFDFSSTTEGELHGIGFDNDLSQDVNNNGFKLFGTQAEGIQNFDTYQTLGQVSHYTIPVGQFLSGNYQYLYFFNDHDVSSPSAQSTFSNIRLYDEALPNVLPSVAITSPVNGLVSTIGENVLLQANASDTDGTIQQVEFFVNHISAGIATAAPFALNWHAEAEGDYSLSAIATDNNGGQTTSNSVVIAVQSATTPNLPPEVSDVNLNVSVSSALMQIDLAQYIADDKGVDWHTLVISASNYGVVRQLSQDSGLIELDYRNANFSGEERLTYSVTDLQGLPSNQGKLIITVDVTAKPAIPTDFIGVLDEQARSISLSWQYGQTDAVFTVQYKKLEEPSWHTLIDSTQSRQSVLPRPLNGTYVFNLKACKTGQASQCSDLVESAAIVVNLAPEAVSTVEATVSANGQVSVQWGQVVDSTHYQIYQRINEGEAVMLNANVTATPYLFTLNQADVNGTYQFAVAACNSKGCSTAVYSEPNTVVLTPAKPEVVTYAEQGDPAYLLAWSQVEHADYYQVQRQDNQGAWQDYIANLTEPRLTVPPQAEFKQAFQVAACNIFGCSDYVVAEQQTQSGVINLISGFYTDAQILAQPQTPITLHWQTQGAISVRLESVIGDEVTLVKGNLPANGSLEVTPSQSSNYRLVATNNTGESQQSDIRVVVKAANASRWQVSDDNHLAVVASSMLVAADGSRFFGDLEGTLHRVGATAWQAEEIGLISSPPLQVGNWLYVSANNLDGQGVVYRVNASTGQERVAVTLPGSLVASPIVRNDGVLLITSEGEIYQFAAGLNNAPIPIRIITLREGEQIRSTPVLSGELLYVRSNQSRLFKLNLATTEASATLGEGQVDANEWIIELKEGQ